MQESVADQFAHDSSGPTVIQVMSDETIFSVYAPPTADLPFLSVIIKSGEANYPLVTVFRTAAEAEAFNLEMGTISAGYTGRFKNNTNSVQTVKP